MNSEETYCWCSNGVGGTWKEIEATSPRDAARVVHKQVDETFSLPGHRILIGQPEPVDDGTYMGDLDGDDITTFLEEERICDNIHSGTTPEQRAALGEKIQKTISEWIEERDLSIFEVPSETIQEFIVTDNSDVAPVS